MFRTAVLLVSIVFLQAVVAEEVAKPKYPRIVVGKVTDVDGNPIKDARIEYGYFSAKAADREFTLSKADGSYRLKAKKAGAEYRLGFSAKGYAPQYASGYIPGPPDKPSEHSVKLFAGARLNLRVTSRNGNPLKDIELRPMTPSRGFHSSFSSPTPSTPWPGEDRTVVTDVDGRVTLESLPTMPGSAYAKGFKGKRNPTLWLGFEIREKDSRGYQTQTLSVEDVAKAKPGEPVPIQVSNSYEQRSHDGVAKGRVIDKETGEPVTDFVVVRRYSPTAQPFSDEDGRFMIGGKFTRGRGYQTRVFAPGYAVCVAKPVANGETVAREQTFELEKHPSLFGRLVDKQGKPVPNVEVVSGVTPERGYTYVEWSTLDSYADGHHSLDNVLRVTTDKDGEFVIPEAPGKQAALIIAAPGFARKVVSAKRRPPVGDDGYVAIELDAAAKLIAVADRTTLFGKHAKRVSIHTKPPDDGFDHMFPRADLDGNGECVFDSLVAGVYTVKLGGGEGLSGYSLKVDLEAGKSTRVSLGKMHGNLTLNGKAVPFANVSVKGRDIEKGSSMFSVRADVDGDFSLSGLLPGKYSVSMNVSTASSGMHRRPASGKAIELKNQDAVIDLIPNPNF